MSNRKVLPFSLVLLFIFTSLSPIVDAFDWDGDGVGDNTDLFPSTSLLGSGSSFTIIAIILISAIGAVVVFRMRKIILQFPKNKLNHLDSKKNSLKIYPMML